MGDNDYIEWGDQLFRGYYDYQDDALDKNKKEAIEVSLRGYKIYGWVALDNSNELWFFPGADNIPTKEYDEWVGLNPIHLQKRVSNPPPENLKIQPEFITFIVRL